MRFFVVSLCLLLLTSCADTPKPRGKPAPDLQYSYLQKLNVFGGGAVIKQSFVNELNTNKDGSDLAIPLPVLLGEYLNDRFLIDDKNPNFEIDINKIEVTRAVHEGTFGGLLGGDEKIVTDIILLFKPLKTNSLDQIYKLTVQRRLIINSDMPLADRELAEVELLEAIIGDIDQKIMTLFAPKTR